MAENKRSPCADAVVLLFFVFVIFIPPILPTISGPDKLAMLLILGDHNT